MRQPWPDPGDIEQFGPRPGPRLAVTTRVHTSASHRERHFTQALHAPAERPSLSPRQKIMEALLLVFHDPIPKECLRLETLSRREWRYALHWLDVSGLALYFLDRLEQQSLCRLLPVEALHGLRRNLADNTARIAALWDEWAAISRDFEAAGLACATLKGFSLGRFSVPRPELRSQLDLDFLIAERSAPEARRILESRGFRLSAIHGRSWEFAAHDTQPLSLRDLYKPVPHRYVELHVESGPSPLLDRVEMRRFHDLVAPVLHPVDLFLGQGLHVYKHLLHEMGRASHVIEFRRHVIARRNDAAFWRELRAVGELHPSGPLGLGVVIALTTRILGRFAPEALTCWTVDRLPPAIRTWAETCSHHAILLDSPSKLYLVLLEALAKSGIPQQKSIRRRLAPYAIPSLSVPAKPGENPEAHRRRTWQHLRSLVGRAGFHIVEDVRYLRESRRWRKAVPRETRDDESSHAAEVHGALIRRF